MTRLYLLGIKHGPNVDCVDGFVINGEDESQEALDRREKELRQTAQQLQRALFDAEKANGKEHEATLTAKYEYGLALREWARFT